MRCREGLGARSGVSREEKLRGVGQGPHFPLLAWPFKGLEDPPKAFGVRESLVP